jgi:membrane-bound lytic murein transglycosylase D
MRLNLMTRKEPRNSVSVIGSHDSSDKKEIHRGLTHTLHALYAGINALSILTTKRFFPVFFFILILLFGSAGAAMEDFSSEVREQSAGQSTKPLDRPDTTAEDQQFSSSGAGVETRPLYLPVDETEGNEEPLIEKSDLRENISIPLVLNDAVKHYIHYFTTTKKDLFKRWLTRKKRYAPLIKEVLREHGLPEDLVYLAMIESGFNLHAYSPMKAAGPWQFIPETGRRYGLALNHWVDERRDIRKSTVAAARYLQELFDQFDCWYLAAAGYNAGENRIDRLIKRYDTKDFWQLRAYNTLPRETREYVPQLIAAAIVAKDPEKYGLGEIENVPTFEFVKETVPGGVPLKTVAKAASSDVSSIRTLNPEIRRGITPPGKDYGIKLPAETDPVTFQSSLTSALNEERRVVGVIRHLTGRRDNVRKITKRYGVSKADLVLVNGSPLLLKRGRLVYIPRFDKAEREEEYTEAKKADFRNTIAHSTLQSKAQPRRAVTHVVKRGETLSVIAAQYGLDVGTLKRINHLKTNRINRGKRLTLVSYVKKAPQRALKKYHRVRRGDTLSQIAEKHGKSAQTIRNMNRLKNNRIQKGMRLRVSSSRIMSRPVFA